MNHVDSEALSLSYRNESQAPIDKLFSGARCVFMFLQSPALSPSLPQYSPNDNVICHAGTADSQMEKNGSHVGGLQIIYRPQIPRDMSFVLSE